MPLDVDSGIELPQLELTHNFTGDCTTAYSTGIIYSTYLYRRLYNSLLYVQVPFTVHICTGDCTTAYSTGMIYSTYLYRRLYNCLLYRYYLQYISVQETVQQPALQTGTIYCT